MGSVQINTGSTIATNVDSSLVGPQQTDRAQSSLPLYSQIKDVLRERILDGTYPVHSKLPSESALVASFSVSRITIRQALRDLNKEGLTFSLQGKGTFVARAKAVRDLTPLQGFGETAARKRHQIVAKLIGAGQIGADRHVAYALGLEDDASVVRIERVYFMSNTPVSLGVSYFSLEIGSRLLREGLASRDILDILENDHGLHLQAAELTIDATLADRHLASQLRVMGGSPILRVERLTYESAGRPVYIEYLYYSSDSYQYRLRVERG